LKEKSLLPTRAKHQKKKDIAHELLEKHSFDHHEGFPITAVLPTGWKGQVLTFENKHIL